MTDLNLSILILKPGRQVVRTSGPMGSIRGTELWLANQIGYNVEGWAVTDIESFQTIQDGVFWRCTAVCRMEEQ